jgi:hypothetical protein
MKLAHFAAILASWVVTAGALAQGQAPQPASPVASPSSMPEARWSDSVTVIVHGPTVVDIRSRCPAMWKLNRGASVIWVMPTLLENIDDGKWDSSCFKRVLRGAGALLVSDEYVMVDSQQTHLPEGKTLKDVVSPASYARFLAEAKRIHVSPYQFETLRPDWAVNYFVSAAFQMEKIRLETYPSDMPDMARDARAKTLVVPFHPPRADLRNIRNQLDAQGDEACMNSILDRLDYTLDVEASVISAWRKADIATVLRLLPQDDPRCYPPGFDWTDISGKANMDEWAMDLESHLDGFPKTTVAAIPLVWLLHKGGVLDQLQAQGVIITSPRGVDN